MVLCTGQGNECVHLLHGDTHEAHFVVDLVFEFIISLLYKPSNMPLVLCHSEFSGLLR